MEICPKCGEFAFDVSIITLMGECSECGYQVKLDELLIYKLDELLIERVINLQ